jgi:hypothetical protein
MKAISLLLSIVFLPLLLAGLNFSFKADAESAMQAYLHPEHNINPLINRTSNPPFSAGIRPPVWRLDAMMTSTAPAGTTNLLPDEKYVYYYSTQYPARVDSIHKMAWDNANSEWDYEYTRYLTYDISGEYITLQAFRHYAAANDFIRQYCFYDTQNRLTDIYMYMYNQVDEVYFLNQRLNFAYTGGNLTRMMEIYPGNGRAYYKKYLIDNDAQGRMESILTVAGPDSVNWGNLAADEISYTAEDTSTGAEYVSYLSHYLLIDDDWGDGYYGKIDFRDYFESWNGIAWIDHERYTYFYNANGLCSEIVRQLMETQFTNVSKYAYTYDANFNLFSRDFMEWDPDAPGWVGSTEQLSYFWSQITANQEETVPVSEITLTAYPNPFGNTLNLSWDRKSTAPVKVNVYNLKGQCLRSLQTKAKQEVWDGKDDQGREAANGIYLITAELDGAVVSRKIFRIR